MAVGHGDLHPGNVLLADGKVLVIDFGHSSPEEDQRVAEYPVQSDLARLALRLSGEVLAHRGHQMDQCVALWAAVAGGCLPEDMQVLAREEPRLAALAEGLGALRARAAECVPRGGGDPEVDADWWCCVFGECLRMVSHVEDYEAQALTAAAAIASAKLFGVTVPSIEDILRDAQAVSRVEGSVGWADEANRLHKLLKGDRSFLVRVKLGERASGNIFAARCEGVANGIDGWRVGRVSPVSARRGESGVSKKVLWRSVCNAFGCPATSPAWDSGEVVAWLAAGPRKRVLLIIPPVHQIPDDDASMMSTRLNEIATARNLPQGWILGVVLLEYAGQEKVPFRMLGVLEETWPVEGYTENDVARLLRATGQVKDGRVDGAARELHRRTGGDCQGVLATVFPWLEGGTLGG